MDKQDQRPTISVPKAGKKYFGLGKNASYDAARRGEIPTVKIGSRLFVPVAALERILEGAASGQDARARSASDQSQRR